MSIYRHIILSCSVVGALAQFPCGLGNDLARAATGPTDSVKVRVRSTIVASGEAPRKLAIGETVGNPLWAIPVRLMSATRDRPLFSPSRRPPPPAMVAAPPSPPPPKPTLPSQPQLSLLGTVVGADHGIAVFVDQTTKDIVRLGIGEGHDGWTLQAVQERSATLERDRRDVTLALPSSKPAAQATASVRQPANAAPPASPEPEQETSVPPGKWRDGDGQIIQPPVVRAANVHGPAAANWVDGDGQLISPPR